MNRDLKMYFLAFCLPMALAAGAGFYFLVRELAEVNIAQRAGQMAKLAESLQRSAARSGTNSLEGVVNDFPELRDVKGALLPTGEFVWKPRGAQQKPDRRSTGVETGAEASRRRSTGAEASNRVETAELVLKRGLSREVCAELERKVHWNDWEAKHSRTAKRVKRPRRGIMAIGSHRVLWRRDKDDVHGDVVRGLVFDEDFLKTKVDAINDSMNDLTDLMRSTKRNVLAIAGVLVVLLAGIFYAGLRVMYLAAKKAREEDAQKTGFLSNCSHELKTPLTSIGIWIELLRTGKMATDERRSRAYEVIANENARMTRLVKNLLDYARLEKGRRRYALEKVDVAALAGEVVELCRGDFAAHGVELRADAGCAAFADPDAVKQILVNLLGNAANYAASGGPVEVEVTHDGLACRVAVKDRGPGLSAEQRRRVFERFYRVDDALNAKTNGLGLGLSISLALARDMGGNLSVSPRAGGGCEFSLELKSPTDAGDGGAPPATCRSGR